MTPEVGDRVKVLSDSVGDTQRSKAKVGQCGTVEMILDDSLVLVTFTGFESVSLWPHELKVIRRKRKK